MHDGRVIVHMFCTDAQPLPGYLTGWARCTTGRPVE